MELCYRGVSYSYEPPVVETTVGEVGGKYRGLNWQLHNLKNPPVLRSTDNLTYRGVKYNKPGTITARTIEPETTLTILYLLNKKLACKL
jgi:hypothetical protein